MAIGAVVVVAADGLTDAVPEGADEAPRVHQVGRRAAGPAGVPRLLEATVPRGVVTRLVRLLRMPMRRDGEVLRTAFSRRAAITYSVGVRWFARQKRAAPAAHRSPVAGTGRLAPVMRALLRLPVPDFGLLLGREWCVEVR